MQKDKYSPTHTYTTNIKCTQTYTLKENKQNYFTQTQMNNKKTVSHSSHKEPNMVASNCDHITG